MYCIIGTLLSAIAVFAEIIQPIQNPSLTYWFVHGDPCTWGIISQSDSAWARVHPRGNSDTVVTTSVNREFIFPEPLESCTGWSLEISTFTEDLPGYFVLACRTEGFDGCDYWGQFAMIANSEWETLRTSATLHEYNADLLRNTRPGATSLQVEVAVFPSLQHPDASLFVSDLVMLWGDILEVDPRRPDTHQSISLYPNPAVTSISYAGPASAYSVYDILGRLVMKGEIKAGMPLGIEHLSSGWYVFRSDHRAIPFQKAR